MASSNPDASSTPPAGSHRGQPISAGLRRRLQACFEHGSQLAKEKDYDYAHEMFAECVTKDPSNLVYVAAMLENLQRKYGNNRKGARFKGFGGKGVLKKAVGNKDWAEVLALGPELLKTNPWDVTTLRGLAHACAALHYNEVELRYLKNALDANPKDLEVNRHCANSLARMGQYDQAIACWHRVEEMTKGSDEAPRKISELTLRKARHAAGIDDDDDEVPSGEKMAAKPAEPPQSTKPPEEPAEPAPVKIRLNPRQKLEKAITDNPTFIDNYLRLAELHTTEGRYGDAEKVLTRALTASDNDPRVRQLLEDAQIRRARARLAIAEKQAATLKDADSAEVVKNLRSDLNRLELEIFDRRCQRYPGDMGAKYELGVRLKRAGNYSEALKYLNPAVDDPKWKVAATLEMGICCQQLRQYPKALQCYAAAARLANEDAERKKLALYRAGVLAQGLKDGDRAVKFLSELIEMDPRYRDAAARLDKAREIGHK